MPADIAGIANFIESSSFQTNPAPPSGRLNTCVNFFINSSLKYQAAVVMKLNVISFRKYQLLSLMSAKRFLFSFALLALYTLAPAQQTTVYTDAQLSYKKGLEFYNSGIYGLAQQEFQQLLDMLEPFNEPELKFIRTRAELYYAKSAVRMNLPDGEKLILDFARTHDPNPMANQAIVEMANFYYNDRKYDKAIQLLSSIDGADLTKSERAEVKFKLGYSQFVKKRFKEARGSFNQIKNIENDYYYPTHYYLGLTEFFEDNYDAAVKSFKIAGKSKRYRPRIPYYIAQIYFAQGDYDKVIEYAKPKLKDRSLKNLAEISQLVGQAYFEKGDFDKALPYLEAYAERTSRLRKEDLYQIGFVQYKAGKYKEAIKNLSELSGINSDMGQNAMYLLADAHLKVGDKSAARNAFKSASRLDFDPAIKQESQWNFAKLSYELNFDREAIAALQQIPPTSPNYAEAQTILSSIFLDSRDYENAMKILEELPEKTPQLKETYQKVAYFRGLQLHQEQKHAEAKAAFSKSLSLPVDAKTRALAVYWLGDIAHHEKQYDTSIRELNKYLSLTKTLSHLPDEASVYTANYTQGYNYLKKKNYGTAQNYFQDAIAGIKQNSMFIRNPFISENVLGDATLRAGDCLFKRNQYNQAIRFYDEAVNNKYAGFVYALYQKAIIEGLRGNTTEKIIALENITEEYPNSPFADNALLQLGITYQDIGKFDRAAEPLRQLIDQYQGKSELINQALLKLGLISYNQGSLQTAISYYKRIFQNNPEPKEAQAALTALEEIYVDDLNQPEQYFAFLETIPGYNVGSAEKESISFKAAETQFENSQYEKAIEGYTKYLRQYSNGRYALASLYHRGESYSVLKRYSHALKDYETIVNKGQSKYYQKALRKAALIAYNHEKDFEKAYGFYNKLETAATDEDMRYEAQLGAMRSAYRINNTEALLATANKVKNNPRATPEQKSAAYFYLGKHAFDTKNYDQALESFNQVAKMSNNEQTAEARYLIAYIYYARRELEVAQQLTLNANKESANYPYWVAKSVILLADILAEKGDYFNAQAALEGLIENYTEDQELVNIAKAKLEKLKSQQAASSRLRADPDDDSTLELLDEEQ